MPPRPKRSAPDCQLSAPQGSTLKAGRLALEAKLVWPLAGQANSSFLPPSSACPARSQNSAAPATLTNRDPASYDSLRSVCVMKDASDSQPQELLSIVPPRCRIPLAREPSANGSPPPHRKASCRRRNPVGPSAARCTKDNSVLWPGRLACLSRSLLCGRLPRPWPPAGPAVRAPVRPRILHATPLTPLL